MRGLLYDLALPRSDAGVAVQAALVLAVFSVALRRTWHTPGLRIFTLGAGLLVLTLMLLRALH